MQVEDFTIFRQIEMTEYIDHLFVVCKGCDENSNIHDGRFKCTICPSYELCANCQKKGVHNNHKLVKDVSWYVCLLFCYLFTIFYFLIFKIFFRQIAGMVVQI